VLSRYDFTTRWELEAPIDKVWDPIFHCETWPAWWDGVRSAVQLEEGGAGRLGSLWRYTWKSALPYELTFDMRLTAVEPPVAMDGAAVGELAGEGSWRLHRTGAGTIVVYEWHVVTTRSWMKLVAPLARPVFAWNHDLVMRQGQVGLARLLRER
jgi:hypothetical protein